MQVAKWGNSLAVRLPKAITDELGIKEGDNLVMEAISDTEVRFRKDNEKSLRRKAAAAKLSELKWALPSDYAFDRGDVYDRRKDEGQ